MSQAARLGIETSELEKIATRNQLINHVTAAFYAYFAAQDAHKLSERSIAAVQSELQQTRAGFEAGTLLKSDVLSLEVQLAEVKDGQIQSGNAIEMAKAMLKTLLGLPAEQDFILSDRDSQPLPTEPEVYEHLLTQAREKHPELKAIEKRAAIAEQYLSAARAAHLPKADAFVSYGSDSENLAYSTSRDNVTAGVMLEVDVFSGFSTQEKIKKAEHQLTAAREAVRQMQLKIENQVKVGRLKLIEALNRGLVTSASVQAAEEALRLVNEQRKAGVVTVTRYIEAEVARDRAITRDIAARYDALRADAELKQATGYWN